MVKEDTHCRITALMKIWDTNICLVYIKCKVNALEISTYYPFSVWFAQIMGLFLKLHT